MPNPILLKPTKTAVLEVWHPFFLRIFFFHMFEETHQRPPYVFTRFKTKELFGTSKQKRSHHVRPGRRKQMIFVIGHGFQVRQRPHPRSGAGVARADSADEFSATSTLPLLQKRASSSRTEIRSTILASKQYLFRLILTSVSQAV